MSELTRTDQQTGKDTQPEEVTLDWRRVLELGLCGSSSQVSAERYWATLCSRMRDLCPETNWISIYERSEHIDPRSIKALQFWLESLITCPEWLFPEQVILIAGGKQDSDFRIVIPKQIAKLPQGKVSRDLCIVPFRDKYSSGWKIKTPETFIAMKAGEA